MSRVAGEGKAVAVWQQLTGTSAFVAASRYDVAAGWTPSTRISGDLGDAYDPHVTSDAAGNASVVWYEMRPDRYAVEVSHAQAGDAWGEPAQIGVLTFDLAFGYPAPAIGGNAAGQTFVVWGVDGL